MTTDYQIDLAMCGVLEKGLLICAEQASTELREKELADFLGELDRENLNLVYKVFMYDARFREDSEFHGIFQNLIDSLTQSDFDGKLPDRHIGVFEIYKKRNPQSTRGRSKKLGQTFRPLFWLGIATTVVFSFTLYQTFFVGGIRVDPNNNCGPSSIFAEFSMTISPKSFWESQFRELDEKIIAADTNLNRTFDSQHETNFKLLRRCLDHAGTNLILIANPK